jgi:hypothetical protein
MCSCTPYSLDNHYSYDLVYARDPLPGEAKEDDAEMIAGIAVNDRKHAGLNTLLQTIPVAVYTTRMITGPTGRALYGYAK